MRVIGWAVAAVLLAGAAVAQEPQVGVMVGGYPGIAACPAQGKAGAEALPVRSGPGAEYPEIEQLAPGTAVYLCDLIAGWRGIVYGGGDCGVMSPIDQRSDYTGSCRSGWVNEADIRLPPG